MIKNQKDRATIILVLLSGVVCIGILLVGAFLYISIGYGNAVVNTVKSVDTAKKEWKSDKVNPIDTILNDIRVFTDSIE
jgi:hypothetical protein